MLIMVIHDHNWWPMWLASTSLTMNKHGRKTFDHGWLLKEKLYIHRLDPCQSQNHLYIDSNSIICRSALPSQIFE